MANQILDILRGNTCPHPPSSSSYGAVLETAPSSPSSPIVERFRKTISNLQKNADFNVEQEIKRICAMPIISDPTPEEIDTVSRYYCPKQEEPLAKLFPEQVKAMMQYHEHQSILCPIKTGGGKSLISVLIANDAYTIFKKRKILLLSPVNIIDQLKDTELPFYRRHISINVPFYWLTKESKQKRLLKAQSNKAGVYVLSYSLVSRAEGADLLEAISPELVIGDEIHRIASDRPSARNRRFREMVKKFNPDLVSLSGTITKKSPANYHFIAVHTLKERCFLPRPSMTAEAWSTIIDSNASSIDEFNSNTTPQPGPIMPLVRWAKSNFPEDYNMFPENLIGFRHSLKKRAETTPGVVASDSEDGGVPIRISNVKLTKEECESRPGWDKLQELVSNLVDNYIAPNGDEIDHAMHIWRWRYELEGFGFYNNLYWPDADKISKNKKISLALAEDILDRSMRHHEYRQEYHRVLRAWIKNHARKNLDTPMLIAKDMFMNGDKNVGGILYKAWMDVKDSESDDLIERDRQAVRVCDFRVRKITQWAKEWDKEHKKKKAILWYRNVEVGKWVYESLKEAGLPVIHCTAGKKGKALLEDRSLGNHFAVTSLTYREGLNLQYHHDTEFFCQWPREADQADQAIGRVPRHGQTSDEARIFISISSDFDKVLFASTLNDAAYVHQTSTRQKLMYANYDEKPSIMPYSVLLEWSGEHRPLRLDDSMSKLLEEKFK